MGIVKKASRKTCSCGHKQIVHDKEGICRIKKCYCDEYTVVYNDSHFEDVETVFNREQ